MSRFQLTPSSGRSRSGDEESTDDLVSRLTRAGSGLGKKDRADRAAKTCDDVYHARRALWMTLMAHAPRRLAAELRARAANRDDYSNRQGIGDLRLALADWLERWDDKQVKKERWYESRGRTFRRQLDLWAMTSWPTLTDQNEKSMATAWPFVDMIADRDSKCLLAASQDGDHHVKESHHLFRRALERAAEWNSRLAIATAKEFFAGPSVNLTMKDLIMEAMDGLYRGLMDYDRNKGKPSTHLVTWCRQRVSKALETGTLIHVPSWVRQTVSAIKRGSPSWVKADKARRKARTREEAKAKAKSLIGSGKADAKARKMEIRDLLEEARDIIEEAGDRAFRLAIGEADNVLGPLDQASVVSAVGEIEAGASVERLEVVLVEALGYHPVQAKATAEVLAAEADPHARFLLAMASIAKAHNRKAPAILEALRLAPSRIDSLDLGQDDESSRPVIVLSSTDEDQDTEAEVWIQTREMLSLLEALADRDDAGAEQAEIIRRSYGLGGPECLSERPESEALTHIARTGLECSGRTIHRNKAAMLRDEGIEWMREVAANGGLRRERRAKKTKPSEAKRLVTKPPKRIRKSPPRVAELDACVAVSAQA